MKRMQRALSATAVIALIASFGVTTSANADMTAYTLKAPKEILAQYPLPYTGTVTTAPVPVATAKAISAMPDNGIVGTAFKLSATGLPANAAVTLVWNTTEAAWRADVDPTTVNYRGTKYTKLSVVMGTTTTDANGALNYETKAPQDFGSVHDIYALVNGVVVAKGGFEIRRYVKISPTSGPLGTPITITYSGLGSSLYQSGAAVNYDNKFAGEMLALWTRGHGTATIIASGKPGMHYISVQDAIGIQYMNILQSPVPNATGDTKAFRVTKDPGLIKPYFIWPDAVTPVADAHTTDVAGSVDPSAAKAVATLTPSSGPVLSKTRLKVTGLPVDGAVDLKFSTVVGSRVDCPNGSTSCWKFNPMSLGSATVTGGVLDADVTIPDNLGGFHVVQVMQGGKLMAQSLFYVKASLDVFKDAKGKVVSVGLARADTRAEKLPAGVGTPTYTFKQGEAFTVSVRGVGWTQMDNTMNVTYDNSHVGYGCGFNSNGYMVVHMVATGEPGTHTVDLWPNLYSANPSFADTQYGMLPLLSGGHDSPALALGYQVPSIHFTIKVVAADKK